jgi:hypothetical protein
MTLRDEIASVIWDETFKRVWYDDIANETRAVVSDITVTADAILALIGERLLSDEAVREGARGIHVANGYDADRMERVPGFMVKDDLMDVRAAIAAALDTVTGDTP